MKAVTSTKGPSNSTILKGKYGTRSKKKLLRQGKLRQRNVRQRRKAEENQQFEDWATDYAKIVLKQTVSQDTIMARHGALPYYICRRKRKESMTNLKEKSSKLCNSKI